VATRTEGTRNNVVKVLLIHDGFVAGGGDERSIGGLTLSLLRCPLLLPLSQHPRLPCPSLLNLALALLLHVKLLRSLARKLRSHEALLLLPLASQAFNVSCRPPLRCHHAPHSKNGANPARGERVVGTGDTLARGAYGRPQQRETVGAQSPQVQGLAG